MESWFQLTIELPSDLSDQVSAMLFDIGSSGLQVEDGSNPWHARLIAYFPSSEDRDVVERRLLAYVKDLASPGAVSVVSGDVPFEDWATAWRAHFQPVYPTPRMVVCPPWHEVASPEGGIAVLIEPKTAFGTGRHPTTRMALQALEDLVKPDDRVLDVGTGSGILAIAARKLGATFVKALDIDPLARANVLENLSLNGISGVGVHVRTVEDQDRGYDVVVANIIISVLIPMLPRLHNAVRRRGWVVLGGLLDREEKQIVDAARQAGMRVAAVTREAEWIGIRAQRART